MNIKIEPLFILSCVMFALWACGKVVFPGVGGVLVWVLPYVINTVVNLIALHFKD